MLGRTLMQPAEVVSFGHKVVGWLAPLVRCRERLRAAGEAALQLQLGGAVGTLAALGDKGPAVARRVGERLGLPVPAGAWHAQRDAWVALGCERRRALRRARQDRPRPGAAGAGRGRRGRRGAPGRAAAPPRRCRTSAIRWRRWSRSPRRRARRTRPRRCSRRCRRRTSAASATGRPSWPSLAVALHGGARRGPRPGRCLRRRPRRRRRADARQHRCPSAGDRRRRRAATSKRPRAVPARPPEAQLAALEPSTRKPAP